MDPWAWGITKTTSISVMHHDAEDDDGDEMTRVHVYRHDPESELTREIVGFLRGFLPWSLPIYRRLQFMHKTDSAFVLSTFAFESGNEWEVEQEQEHGTNGGPSNGTTKGKETEGPQQRHNDEDEFTLAFIDRSRRPETEVWIFSSAELKVNRSRPNGTTKGPAKLPLDPSAGTGELNLTNSSSPSSFQQARAAGYTGTLPQWLLSTSHLHSLLQHISLLPLSPAPASDEPSQLRSSNPYEAHSLSSNLLLLGSLHTFPTLMLKSLPEGILRSDLPGLDLPYAKYVFALSALPPPAELPAGLVWTKVAPGNFALVRSRTSIPRRDRTLKLLPSVGVVEEEGKEKKGGGLVSWAFLGLDGSLTSLHVEEGWRGRGLGKGVAGRLFRETLGRGKGFGGGKGKGKGKEQDGEDSEEEEYAHADVALDNKESSGVARSLGGVAMWEVYWVRVDLDKV